MLLDASSGAARRGWTPSPPALLRVSLSTEPVQLGDVFRVSAADEGCNEAAHVLRATLGSVSRVDAWKCTCPDARCGSALPGHSVVHAEASDGRDARVAAI